MIFGMQSLLKTDIIFLHLFLSIPCMLNSSILHCTLKKTSKRYTLIRPSGATGFHFNLSRTDTVNLLRVLSHQGPAFLV